MNPLENLSKISLPTGIEYHPTLSMMDSSKVQAIYECPRRAFFNYILGWQPKSPNIHTTFGSSIHIGMEHLLKGGSAHEAYALFYADFEKEYGTGPYDHPSKNPDKAQQMFNAYQDRYYDDWELLYTEISGKVPIILDPYRIDLNLRIDAIVKRKDGRLMIIDHKTATRVSAFTYTQYVRSVQVNTYIHAAAAYWGWKNIYGMLLNFLVFFKREKEPYGFDRVTILRTPEDIEQYLVTTRGVVDNYIYDMNRLADPDIIKKSTMRSEGMRGIETELFPPNPKSCTLYNQICPYDAPCHAWKNPLQHIAHGEIPNDMKIERWHPDEVRESNYVLENGEFKKKEKNNE